MLHVYNGGNIQPGWLDTDPVPGATAQNTILGLGLWQHGTPRELSHTTGLISELVSQTQPESTGLIGVPYSQSCASLWEN